MKRRAPVGGYDFPEKRQYRRQAWNAIAGAVRTFGNIKRCHALLMPSSEATEVAVAESKGFLRRNLHAVDSSVAIAATISRKYPGIDAKGGLVSDACKRMAGDGVRLHAANLDLCGSVGDKYLREVSDVSRCGIWAKWAVVGITALRGREDSETITHLQDIGVQAMPLGKYQVRGTEYIETDLGRLGLVGSVLGGWAYMADLLLRFGIYRSTAGNQTMIWGVYLLWDIDDALRTFAHRQNRLAGTIYDKAVSRARHVEKYLALAAQ